MEITQDEFNAMIQTNDIVLLAKVCYGAKKAYMEAKGEFIRAWDDEENLIHDIEITIIESMLRGDDGVCFLNDIKMAQLYKAIINTLK